MKRTICLFLFVFSLAWVFAGFIAADEAGEIGSAFFTAMGGREYDQYTIEGFYGKEGSGQPAFYIIRFKPVGFLLLAADDRSQPILAFSETDQFSESNLPPNLKYMLDSYSEGIYDLKNKSECPVNPEWSLLRKGDFSAYAPDMTRNVDLHEQIPTWGQTKYYNAFCPQDDSVDPEYDGHVPAGCTAVAMAQIIRYYKQPYRGSGSNSYTPETHPEYGVQSVNFENARYDHTTPLDTLTTGNNDVARLIYHCGVSINMDYDPEGSGANIDSVATAFVDHFRYNSADVQYRNSTGDPLWFMALKAELDAGRPIYYRGKSLHADPDSVSAHAFVLEGYAVYSNLDYFYINWGWNGHSNGQFSLTPIPVFTQDQAAIFNLYPLPKPNSPITLAITNSSPFSLLLSWTDNSNNEEGFHIERKLGGVAAEWVGIASVGANVTSYLDGGLTSGYIYNYRIRSFNGNGFSDYSAELNTGTPFYECVIESSIEQISPSQIRIEWASQPNAYQYALYSADEPLSTEDPGWTLVTEGAILGRTETAAADRKFYHVKVKLIVSAPSNMIHVPGRTFNPTSSYTVSLSSFYIGKYEVTQSEYQAVMGTNPSYFGGNPNRPVEQVSWFKAIEFCNRRSMQEGFIPCYSYSSYGTNPDNWPAGWNTSYTNHTNVSCNWSANGYRLPTEMEWMFAAKGGNQSQGYTYSGSNNIDVVAWYRTNAYDVGSGHPDYGTHNVGTKASNELGTFDMSGNVWEWCWDIYGSYPSGSYTDPTGPAGGSSRVYRGGSWSSDANYCTVSYRISYGATGTGYGIGFRCLRVSP